ncbi:sporulation protein SPS19 [Halenospora varia]|nr:sporulation protein SPS19 [Halenospora varia]
MVISKNDYLSDVWKDGIFNNKVVFCTGGSGDICSAQVRALVHLGANACIVGRNIEKVERMAKSIETARVGSKVIGIGTFAVEKCVQELGGIDFLIAGAAGNFLAPITQLSTNAFKSVIDIDVLGSYNTVKAALPHLIISAKKYKTDGRTTAIAGTGGRIIFVSATIHYTGMPLQSHVAVAKAGVDSLANAIALEFGPRGLTSNIIAPGPIEGTEGLSRLVRSEDVASSLKKVPVGRYGTIKEIADATIYLFSDSGNFVNGETLVGFRARVLVGAGFEYPEFLLADEQVTGVEGGRANKL